MKYPEFTFSSDAKFQPYSTCWVYRWSDLGQDTSETYSSAGDGQEIHEYLGCHGDMTELMLKHIAFNRSVGPSFLSYVSQSVHPSIGR